MAYWAQSTKRWVNPGKNIPARKEIITIPKISKEQKNRWISLNYQLRIWGAHWYMRENLQRPRAGMVKFCLHLCTMFSVIGLYLRGKLKPARTLKKVQKEKLKKKLGLISP